jgi:hypothetical protein
LMVPGGRVERRSAADDQLLGFAPCGGPPDLWKGSWPSCGEWPGGLAGRRGVPPGKGSYAASCSCADAALSRMICSTGLAVYLLRTTSDCPHILEMPRLPEGCQLRIGGTNWAENFENRTAGRTLDCFGGIDGIPLPSTRSAAVFVDHRRSPVHAPAFTAFPGSFDESRGATF